MTHFTTIKLILLFLKSMLKNTFLLLLLSELLKRLLRWIAGTHTTVVISWAQDTLAMALQSRGLVKTHSTDVPIGSSTSLESNVLKCSHVIKLETKATRNQDLQLGAGEIARW